MLVLQRSVRTLLVGVALFTMCFVDASAADGDTIRVKTLTFADITKRSGTWLFPPPQRYEKVLMEYTLKCDPATTQDNFPCGEWDYLTYTVLRDSTGEFDSTNRTQVNYVVRGTTPDTFAFTNNSVQPRKRYRSTLVNRGGSEGTFVPVGSGGQSNTALIRTDGGRIRFIWRASELTGEGIAAGRINGITINALDSVGVVILLTVQMGQTTGTTISSTLNSTDLTTVVRRNQQINKGENKLSFSSPFMWDGTSNIVIDMLCFGAPKNAGIEAGVASQNGVAAEGSKYAFSFTESDRIELPIESGSTYGSEITIALWTWGDIAALPTALNTIEGFNVNNQRVVNIHLPWDNGNVYWDAGRNSNGNVDRIEKATIAENYEGRWNHWAFTKNATTGLMRMYLNGELFHEGNGKTLSLAGITRIIVGSGNAGSYEGVIDEFQIWNKALNQATIKTWMHRRLQNTHPDFQRLQLYYSAESESAPFLARDESDYSRHGTMFGAPTRVSLAGDMLGHLQATSTSRPVLSFETGTVNVTTSRSDVDLPQTPVRTMVVKYDRPVQPRIYRATDADHPSVSTDTLVVHQAGWLPIVDETGLKADSFFVTPQTVLRKMQQPYFDPVVDFEIGRYITPYGIGLDLGPKGFKWVYDVTDFAPLLRDNVTLSAGNQQELIDLTFIFIKGTPPRDVKQIDQVWYERGAMFPAVLANTSLAPVSVPLTADARTFRLKAVTSGHDFSNATNCAEFCQREHFFSVDGTERFKWNLWTECGDNPVFPQGGTWLIDRTGWCPGAPVDLYEFEVTPYTTGKSSITLDYGVKKKAAAENWGRWEVSGQLIGYGSANHALDVELFDVISPNSWEFYGRLNPICGQPMIVIRNSGSTALTTCTIEYGAVGGAMSTHTWNGNLAFMQRDTIALSPPAWPTTEGTHTFVVRATAPNQGTDQYPVNSEKKTSFVMPPLFYNDLQIVLRTNNEAAAQYEWKLKNVNGTVIGSGANLSDNTTYTNDYVLADGCYDYELINKEGYGLDFWFLRDQLGTGSLQFKSGGVTAKNFEPDFGNKAWMQFIVAPKPTIAANEDTLFFTALINTMDKDTVGITAITDADLYIDSVNAFSLRNHFSIQSTSISLPATLKKGDTLWVVVGFQRNDAGTTSGSLRIYNSDERNGVKSVRLVGDAVVSGVEEENTRLLQGLEIGVIPNPMSSAGQIVVQSALPGVTHGHCTITITDLTGTPLMQIYQGALEMEELRFDVPASISSGVYVVSIATVHGVVASTFVVSK